MQIAQPLLIAIEELSRLPGIGKKTAQDLLKNFKSVKRVKEASLENLADKIGISKAKKVYGTFH